MLGVAAVTVKKRRETFSSVGGTCTPGFPEQPGVSGPGDRAREGQLL